jgi:hypothetical protein
LVDWKMKISVLWLFAALAFLSYVILELMEPGVIAQVTAGKIEFYTISSAMLLFFAIMMLVPLVMAFLSLTLKGSVNCWANIIVGAVWVVWSFVGVVLAVQKLSAGRTLVALAVLVASALIVWYAWKSKVM